MSTLHILPIKKNPLTLHPGTLMGLCIRFRVLARLMAMVDVGVERCWGIGTDMNVVMIRKKWDVYAAHS